MIITDSRHKKLLEDLLDYFDIGADKVAELSEPQVYKMLFDKTNVDGIDGVYNYMLNGSDFFEAPASTRFHGNYEKALSIHCLIVLALLVKKNEDYQLGLTDTQMIISALCHDLCKCNFYVSDFRNEKVYEGSPDYVPSYNKKPLSDPKGNFCWRTKKSYSIEEKLPLGHGNKSLFILMNYIKVDKTIAMLITWHMGPYANQADNTYGYNNACLDVPAVCAMHTSDVEASMLFEKTIEAVYVD